MSAAFTPGPWTHSPRQMPSGMYDTEVYCKDGKTIATLSWYPMPKTASGVTGTYRTANARLIAAAPELLAACHAFVEYEQTDDADGMEMMFAYSALKKAVYAAIDKAIGVSA